MKSICYVAGTYNGYQIITPLNKGELLPERMALCPAREWVDLTPEEIDDLVAYPWGETKDWVAAVAAKLKEKNT